MSKHIKMPCNGCNGMRTDGTGDCCLCHRRWMSPMLRKWGEHLVCLECIEERRKKDLEVKENEK